MNTETTISQTEAHRKVMADKMTKIAAAMGELLDYWVSENLPSDFLAGEEYPFDLSLDEAVANVYDAAERLTLR